MGTDLTIEPGDLVSGLEPNERVEVQRLARNRDYLLLPKLIFGALDVSALERETDRAKP